MIMGLFGLIGRKIKNAIKSSVRAVGRVYKAFTGQATFEEADRLYGDVKKRFEEHKAFFEREVDTLSSQIETHVQSINQSKVTIKKELFPAFADKLRRLKDIPVSDNYFKDYFEGTTLKVDSMKAKSDLYLIDFKKNPFKSNVLAIISFGFYTRKKDK